MGSSCLQVNQLDLVFGDRPQKAFAALDEGKTREEIQRLTGQVVGVEKASFSVSRGEVLVLMGLSGSGKSSLLRCLNGMMGRDVGATRGEVLYRDSESSPAVSIFRCPTPQLREIRRHQISMVFQQFGLMPWKTVFENIAYPLELQKLQQEEIEVRVNEQIDLVGLSTWKNRFPHELSGGMQQRVGLARAFATNAQILLMDEPFSALDPLHRKHLQDEILRLQKILKKTIVFVTHDLNEAMRIGTRVAVMDAGRVLQIAEPQELLDRPAHERVREFLGATI